MRLGHLRHEGSWRPALGLAVDDVSCVSEQVALEVEADAYDKAPGRVRLLLLGAPLERWSPVFLEELQGLVLPGLKVDRRCKV